MAQKNNRKPNAFGYSLQYIIQTVNDFVKNTHINSSDTLFNTKSISLAPVNHVLRFLSAANAGIRKLFLFKGNAA